MIGRALTGVALIAVVALASGAGAGWPSSGAARPASPLSASAIVLPGSVLFGDPAVAQVTVAVDSGVVDPSTVRVVPSFTPFVESAPPVVSRSSVGSQVTYRYRYSIQCTSDGCLPTGRSRVVSLPDVRVTAQAGARPLTMIASWPAVTVESRLSSADIKAASPGFRHSAPLPAPHYAVQPGALALSLTVVGVILGGVAVVLLGLELVALGRRRRARSASRTPLEAALAFVRDAARRRDANDRRKALELLAEALEAEDEPSLAGTAWEAAWARQPPSSERALEVVEDVEALAGSEPA